MEDGEIERLEKEMTPELACDIISKIFEELKKGNHVISLYGLGILGRKEIDFLTKHEVAYFLTEFTKELFGIKEVEE